MKTDPHDSVREKTAIILRKLSDKAVPSIMGYAPEVQTRIAKAFRREKNAKKARELAFHLSDWNYDAAFLIALHANPNAFTDAEVRAGVGLFLVHAPWHIGEACRITGSLPPDDFKPRKNEKTPKEELPRIGRAPRARKR